MKSSDRCHREALLLEQMKTRILVLDSAMGTAIQNLNLSAEDFGGSALDGCNENLNFTRPEAIRDIHRRNLEAGADVLETNTFGATALVLAEYDLVDQTEACNRRAAELAREVCDEYSTPDHPRFVAGSMGPTTRSISVTGGVSFSEMRRYFYQQAKGLVAGGADYLLLETVQDTLNLKAGLLGLNDLFEELGYPVPVAVSGTIEPTGTMLAGQSVEALYTSLRHWPLLYLGLNCATGPDFMTDHLRSLAALAHFPVACVPNAGLPDEDGRYLESPEMLAASVERFMAAGWINVVGGCCGTTPEHIRALADRASEYAPRQATPERRTLVSGIDFLEINDDTRPLLVGERTNVLGSRKFKRLIAKGNFDRASEIARAQVKGGAQVIDVGLADPDRDEKGDMEHFLPQVVRKVKAPIMIDSTDAEVIELALSHCQGRSIINSINLEDGESRFQLIVPIARQYGAALIVGCIDDDPDQGMAVSRERKVEVARRAFDLLVGKYGVLEEDIIFDPLVFPCATGAEGYVGSAVETIEGIRAIKAAFPLCKTVLGISNVSFGLPPAGREVLNSVFLYHCTKAGLDMAIVNAERLERYASIPEEERKLAEDLLFNRGEDPIAAFAGHFKTARARRAPAITLTIDERLANYIIEGLKEGLIEDLEHRRQELTPLELINGPLMSGMAEVGRLFNRNELIVAEVLQSAEAMKAAVSHLEPFISKSESRSRGKLLLATVKGDVHDIGKNLVDIIFSNNGYEVVNLGIKVSPETLIAACREHRPDLIGLSGLLVKSAQQMLVTAADLKVAGVDVPLLVGGAALSRRFADTRIAPAYDGLVLYAQDAMHGLELANAHMGEATREGLALETRSRQERSVRLQESGTTDAGLANTMGVADGGGSTEAAKVASVTGTTESAKVTGATESAKVTGTTESAKVTGATESAKVTESTGLTDGKKVADVSALAEAGGTPVIPSSVSRDIVAPQPPDLERHVLRDLAAGEIQVYLNPRMLYGKHLGLKGNIRSKIEGKDEKYVELEQTVEEVKSFCADGRMRINAVYGFFPAEAEGDRLSVVGRGGAEIFDFPRQKRSPHLCLADYCLPPYEGSRDHVALFVVTAGEGIRELAETLKAEGEFLKCHALQALALETAEAAAEWIHKRIRSAWGFPDPLELTVENVLDAKYRGKRYSFGYPACPELEDQEKLFRLLEPESIGVTLTEGFMMEPEASVSAIVFHHPEARYFSV